MAELVEHDVIEIRYEDALRRILGLGDDEPLPLIREVINQPARERIQIVLAGSGHSERIPEQWRSRRSIARL